MICRISFQFSKPVFNFGEGFPVCDVVNNDNALAPTIVAGGQGPEPLLASCIPDGQLDFVAIDLDRFNFEVDALEERRIVTQKI